jgi:phage-related baseplate assembly protein
MAIIDLSQLPAPLVIESLDFESLFAVRKEAFIALYPADQQDAVRLTKIMKLTRCSICIRGRRLNQCALRLRRS